MMYALLMFRFINLLCKNLNITQKWLSIKDVKCYATATTDIFKKQKIIRRNSNCLLYFCLKIKKNFHLIYEDIFALQHLFACALVLYVCVCVCV